MAGASGSAGFRIAVAAVFVLFLSVGGFLLNAEPTDMFPQPEPPRRPAAEPEAVSLFDSRPPLPVVVPALADELAGEYTWHNGTGNPTGLTLKADATCVVTQGCCFGEPAIVAGKWRREGGLLKVEFPAGAGGKWCFCPSQLKVLKVQPGYLLVVDIENAVRLSSRYEGQGVKRFFEAPREWVRTAFAPGAVFDELYRCTHGRIGDDSPLPFAEAP